MGAGIKEFLSQIKIGAKQTHRNMTLYCLLSAQEAPVDFLTLDEAYRDRFSYVPSVGINGFPEIPIPAQKAWWIGAATSRVVDRISLVSLSVQQRPIQRRSSSY
jgi:hypothetical protein